MNTDRSTRTALFAGSFNPFTIGHADIVERALLIFDRVVIGVGANMSKPETDSADRVAVISALYAGEERVNVMQYKGLTADLCHSVRADVLLRSVRSAADYDYERNLAEINLKVLGVDTVLMVADPALSFVSSSMVRELKAFGHDVSKFLPVRK